MYGVLWLHTGNGSHSTAYNSISFLPVVVASYDIVADRIQMRGVIKQRMLLCAVEKTGQGQYH